MSEEDPRGSEQEAEPAGTPPREQQPSAGREGHGSPTCNLPPPAFPPGERRRAIRRRTRPDSPGSDGTPSKLRDEAFISPDDPIRKQGRGIPDDAFISPDDPLVPSGREEDGLVTGMSLLPRPRTEAASLRRKRPNIHELPYLLDQLAEQLQDAGETALEVHPDMGQFQAALRSFLKGYLEGSRE